MFKTIHLILLVILSSTFLYSQEADPMAEDYELMMPCEEHKLFNQLVGKWEQEYKFYVAPGTEPTTSKGKAESELILGGRFLQTKASGEAMGTVIESLGLMGFDRRFNKYTAYGFDTMGTYVVNPKGDYNSSSKILTLTGKNYEMMLNDYSDYRMVYYLDKVDEYKFELYFTFPGKEEVKYLEILSKRIK